MSNRLKITYVGIVITFNLETLIMNKKTVIYPDFPVKLKNQIAKTLFPNIRDPDSALLVGKGHYSREMMDRIGNRGGAFILIQNDVNCDHKSGHTWEDSIVPLENIQRLREVFATNSVRLFCSNNRCGGYYLAIEITGGLADSLVAYRDLKIEK